MLKLRRKKYFQGRLFVSPEGERNVTILHMEGDHSIIQTDGFAVSLITDEEDTPYQPMFYFGIIKVLSEFRIEISLYCTEPLIILP